MYPVEYTYLHIYIYILSTISFIFISYKDIRRNFIIDNHYLIILHKTNLSFFIYEYVKLNRKEII